jgi:hypothetical protein
LGLLAALPLGRIALLWSQNNPLPPVAEPELVLSGTWLLDAGDLASEASA